MPVALAPVFWAAVVGAGATTATGIYGAKKQSSATKDAAALQTQAANHAADLQSKAAEDALAFQKQQAQIELQNQANAQLASYDQYAARQRALSTLGQEVGLPAREIPDAPAYLRQQASGTAGDVLTPPGASTGTPGPSGTSAAADYGNLSDPNTWMGLVGDKTKLTSWVQQGLGPKASQDLVNYYVGKIQGQPGANPTEQAGSANYWLNKLQNDPNITGKSATAAATGPKLPYALASLMLQPPTSPGVVMPSTYA